MYADGSPNLDRHPEGQSKETMVATVDMHWKTKYFEVTEQNELLQGEFQNLVPATKDAHSPSTIVVLGMTRDCVRYDLH